MKIKMSDEFIYRVTDENLNLFKEFNTCKENVVRNNSNIKPYAGEWMKIKINNFYLHHVKPTETIKKIATLYGVDDLKLMRDNQLKENKLFIGQILKIYKK